MGGIIRSAEWWWEYFKSLFHVTNYYISGTITLGPGYHELEIDTPFGQNPTDVFLSCDEPDDVAVCIADVNWVASKLRPDGFILLANIGANSCTIKYVVQFDDDSNGPIIIDE